MKIITVNCAIAILMLSACGADAGMPHDSRDSMEAALAVGVLQTAEDLTDASPAALPVVERRDRPQRRYDPVSDAAPTASPNPEPTPASPPLTAVSASSTSDSPPATSYKESQPGARVDAAHFAYPRGWTNTGGGSGGRIVRVTSLAESGAGSLRAALEEVGPRIVVFEVSGIIDLNGSTLRINNPYVTIAGQTAPSPGITVIRGQVQTYTHDIIIQHMRFRPGTGAGSSADALETQSGSYNVIVDHCSLSWGTDETLSAAGWAFNGANLNEWQSNTSNRITFSHNIIAEGLRAGDQGYGTLVEDNATQILIYGNYFAHHVERSPHFEGGTQGAVINNLIYNPAWKFLDYTFRDSKWDGEGRGMRSAGKIIAIGNVGRAGPSTSAHAFFETVSNGDVEYYQSDNVATMLNGSTYRETAESNHLSPTGRILQKGAPPIVVPGVTPMPSSEVEAYVHASVGARPWDRDGHDARVLADHKNRTGRLINSENDVGGYPGAAVNRRAFDPSQWDLGTMVPHSASALW